MVIYTVGYPPRLVPVSLVLPGLDVRSGSVFAPYVAPAPAPAPVRSATAAALSANAPAPAAARSASAPAPAAAGLAAVMTAPGPLAEPPAADAEAAAAASMAPAPSMGPGAAPAPAARRPSPKPPLNTTLSRVLGVKAAAAAGVASPSPDVKVQLQPLSGTLCPAAASCHQSLSLSIIALSFTKTLFRQCQRCCLTFSLCCSMIVRIACQDRVAKLRFVSCMAGLSGVDTERLDQQDGQQGACPCTCRQQGSCQAGRHQGRRQGSAVAHWPPPGAGARAQRRLCDHCPWPGDTPHMRMASLPALLKPNVCRKTNARCCCASAAPAIRRLHLARAYT